jgi:transcriptional regulator with PAS, ATPase and Fis domain
MKIMLAWIGKADSGASSSNNLDKPGPIAAALRARRFDKVYLLVSLTLGDEAKKRAERRDARCFIEWLRARHETVVHCREAELDGPTNHEAIYRSAAALIEDVRKEAPGAQITYHLSPGTPAMASVWLLLAKTTHPASLIESSPQQGVKDVNVPFDLTAEFVPAAEARRAEEFARLFEGLAPDTSAFEGILHRCAAMREVIARGARLAATSESVLIQGESGTGKEMFARAIHNASPRSAHKFVPVNCGAIPPELVDAELFGHTKGAFTGASGNRKGHFRTADKGTLFLDEIGELPPASQVRLLRALQERKIRPVGTDEEVPIDVRVIAATHRTLPVEVLAGRFREDLYYRLAIGVLMLPPLRERSGDLALLIDAHLAEINGMREIVPSAEKHKKISSEAKNILLRHSWPGNVRELYNTLMRACLWAAGDKITAAHVLEALALGMPPKHDQILGRQMNEGFSLQAVLDEVMRHYLGRAIEQAHGNKSEAARLLGLRSYQTLTNWMKRHGND